MAKSPGIGPQMPGTTIVRSLKTSRLDSAPPEEVVNGWINSPGHRRNLLNPTYTDLGVGYVNLENDTGSVNYNTYWTQLFGSGDSVAEQAPSLPPVTPAKAPEPTVVAEMPAAPMQPETPAAAPNTADMTADAPDALQPVAQPVVQLSFEESLCRIANDMATEGVANNAKLYGDAEWTEGKVDGGILLDGMDDLITINRSPEINLGESVDQRTISMGFNADDVSAERELVIFEEGGFLRGLNLYIEDDLLYFGGWSGEENDWEDSWVSLGNVSLTTRFENGFGFGGNSGLAGSVDEVQMFNDALTGSQIQ